MNSTNVREILPRLEFIVLSAIDVDDQIADNLRVILTVLTEVADLARKRHHNLTLEVRKFYTKQAPNLICSKSRTSTHWIPLYILKYNI